MNRQAMLERAANETFDLLVIGGGITGAGIAREAALAGLRVALVERADFASGTSSRSTKLIHGGLRYLRNYEFRLVHESVVERQRMLRMAPHLVHPLRFVFPVYRGDPDPVWKLKLGLMVYDGFAGPSNKIRHKMYGARGLLELEPLLRPDGLVGGGVYTDSATDDARLVIEVIQSGVEHGVAAANYVEVDSLVEDDRGQVAGGRVRDRIGGGQFEIRAQRVLSAAGPWADHVRRLEDPAARPLLRLTKGAHITVPRSRLPVSHAVTIRGDDERVMFAIPSYAYTYIGTTDTDYTGDPAAVTADWADVGYILRAARLNFPAASIGPEEVVGTWAGLRPLIASDASDPSATSRDYKLSHGPKGMVSVAGGKLTAFRAMAAHIVDEVFPATRRARGRARSMAPLPGAPQQPPSLDLVAHLARETNEPAEEVERVVNRYGRAFGGVLRDYDAHSAEVGPARAWRLAQMRRAVEAEMAMHLEDVLWRRTNLLLFSPDNGLRDIEELAQEMGRLHGWSASQVADETASARALVQHMFAWRESATSDLSARSPAQVGGSVT
jgi:glycerol-3-phosphate dehydrogenase